MFKKSLAAEIASGMSQVLDSNEHKSLFSSPTLNKFAAKKKENEVKKPNKKEDKKNSKKNKADKNNCGPMSKERGKKVKVIKIKKADALRVAVDGIAKISAVLDEMGFSKSSLVTLAALDSIVKEAQDKEPASDGKGSIPEEVEIVWEDFVPVEDLSDSFTESAKKQLDSSEADDKDAAEEDVVEEESFEDFFKGIVGDEPMMDAFTEAAKKKLDSAEVDDVVTEVPEMVVNHDNKKELTDEEKAQLAELEEIERDVLSQMDSNNVDEMEMPEVTITPNSAGEPTEYEHLMAELDRLGEEAVKSIEE